MEARLEHLWARGEWAIYISDRGGRHGARRVAKPLDVEREEGFAPYSRPIEWVEITEGALGPVEPTFIMPTEFLEAIVKAGQEERGIMEPSAAMAEHLADVRSMRDRLLVLIEKGASYPVPLTPIEGRIEGTD